MSMELRVVVYQVDGEKWGTLMDVHSISLTVPRQDKPTLALSVPTQTELGRGGSLLDGEVELAVEYTTDGGRTWVEPPNARFTTTERSTDLLDDGTKALSVKAIHLGDRLTEAFVWDVPTQGADSDGKMNFLSVTAGTILSTVWQAAQKRGWGKSLTKDFDDKRDSAGQPWAKIMTIAYAPEIDLESIADSLVKLGMIDTVWEGRKFRAFNADTELARQLETHWPLGRGTTSAPEVVSWDDICTDVLVVGEGGRTWRIHNDAAPPGARRIEKTVNAGGVELEATARLVAEATLRQGAEPAQEITREWHAADSTLLPYVDYRPGDWMYIQRASAGIGLDKYRVSQIGMTFDSNGLHGTTTFGTFLDDYLSKLAKRQKGIAGLASTSGSGVRPNKPADRRVPAAPQGLVVVGRVVQYDTGTHGGVVEADWADVTVDTRGTAITLSAYEQEYRILRGGGDTMPNQGSIVRSTASANALAESSFPGDRVWVRVRAVSEDGVTSAWSGWRDVLIPKDIEAPPVPSVPVLSQTQGVLVVTWDGTSHNGGGMPADLDHLEFAVSPEEAGPERLRARLDPFSRTSPVAGLGTGGFSVVMRAVDKTGNQSNWSKPATIKLEATVDEGAISKSVDKALQNSQAIENAAKVQALKTLKGLDASGVIESPYPPDEGTVGVSYWVAPDGRVFKLSKKGNMA